MSEEQGQQEVGGIPGAPVTKRVEYRGVIIGVLAGEKGSKRIHMLDPGTATEHVIPMDAEHAKDIGQALLSESVHVASPAEAEELAKLSEQK